MAPERWRQIEELYHAARERGSAVLAGIDPELRREVERLLAQHSDGKILDQPAAELLEESTVTQWDLSGQTVSHYCIAGSGPEPRAQTRRRRGCAAGILVRRRALPARACTR